jgi:hypothetical protein
LLRDTVFLRNVCINTLHKGDSDDDDDNNNNNIIGATGTISKSFRTYVSIIPGNLEVRELQKTAILGTAHRLRKVLM